MNYNTSIGLKIKELRNAKKFTLKYLSEETNLSIGFLSQLERGMTSVAVDSLAKIARVLEVNVLDFSTTLMKVINLVSQEVMIESTLQ